MARGARHGGGGIGAHVLPRQSGSLPRDLRAARRRLGGERDPAGAAGRRMTRGGVQEQARRAAAAAGAALTALVGLVPGARAAAPARYLPPDGAPYPAPEGRVRTSGIGRASCRERVEISGG